ncbi:hypothetical protein Elgi_36930 [Paenibacillus elgii]|uniref:hypothetical protein n=1 Tax=Paenibacillus elgii TaxID=189691 RepID=UPI002D7DAD18|nr:hypothetical protein Elgi_36930 [Paenibacillus elgii]
MGKGIIQNYIMIDGGKCYTCNGRGLVDDKCTLPKPRIEYEPPKWVIEKENRTMQQTHNNKRTVEQRSKKVLVDLFHIDKLDKIEQVLITDDVLSCIDSWTYTYEGLAKMCDMEFQKVIMDAYEDYKQYA